MADRSSYDAVNAARPIARGIGDADESVTDVEAIGAVPAPIWKVTLFGKLRASSRGSVLDRFQTQKIGSLLALLAFQRGKRVSREEAIEILWPDAEPSAARDRLSQALVWLRRELEADDAARGSVLVADRLSIGLDARSVSTDVSTFNQLLNLGRQAATPELKIDAIERALSLYTGDLLVGQYDDWVLTERRRLTDDYIRALADIVAHYEAAGEYDRALSAAKRAVVADELREDSHAHVIRLLARAGQPAAALRQFADLRRLLSKAFDTEPSAEIIALAESIKSAKSAANSPSRAPLIDSSALPAPLTRFFGRENQIEDVRLQLAADSVRLVTLTGTGGSGKTRLALAVGAQLRETTATAVVFVPIADLADVNLVVPAIANGFKLPDAGTSGRSASEQLCEALVDKSCVLILDNLEHVVDGIAPILRGLLERSSGLKILATSRQRLGLDGEREMPVPPLPVPSSESLLADIAASASVRLFVDRAAAVRPGFAVNTANAKSIAEICARLEGIPLAIELCAAWAQTLTPQQMLKKLDRRFELLVSRRLDITPRHRTLRAAVEYGYLQLPLDLQRLFTRLSVFRGGWDLQSAASVCSESKQADSLAMLGALTELRERSLIIAEEVEIRSGEPEMRFRMLETLREFAGEQLTYAERAIRRSTHAVYFTALAERSEVKVSGPEQKRWLTLLDSEKENLRAALGWALDTGAIEAGLRLGSALGAYWSIRGPLTEAYDWLKQLLDGASAATGTAAQIPQRVIAKAWRTLGHVSWSQANYSIARQAHTTALNIRRSEGDVPGITESLYHLGITAYRQDDYDSAKQYLEESLDLARNLSDDASIARVLLNLGNIAYGEQRLEDGLEILQQALDIFHRLADQQRVADTMNNMGLIALAMQDNARAMVLFEDGLSIYQNLTNHNGAAVVLANLGTLARVVGDNGKARTHLIEGLRIASDYGNRFIIIHYLLQLGILESTENEPKRGTMLMSAAERLSAEIDGARKMDDADGYQSALSVSRESLGDSEFENLWALGRKLPMSSVIAIALSPRSSGFVPVSLPSMTKNEC